MLPFSIPPTSCIFYEFIFVPGNLFSVKRILLTLRCMLYVYKTLKKIKKTLGTPQNVKKIEALKNIKTLLIVHFSNIFCSPTLPRYKSLDSDLTYFVEFLQHNFRQGIVFYFQNYFFLDLPYCKAHIM